MLCSFNEHCTAKLYTKSMNRYHKKGNFMVYHMSLYVNNTGETYRNLNTYDNDVNSRENIHCI